MNRRQKIIVSVVGIFIVLLALVGITYGYFLTRIQGNTNTTSITVTTADLKLVYGDGNNIITGNNIEPGWTTNGLNGNPEAKTFTIKNEGNATVENFNIYLEDVVNTITRKIDLIYTITCENTTEGATSTECEDFVEIQNEVNSEGELVFPSVMSIIARDTLDPKTATTNAEEHTYTIKVTYKEAGIDQSEDMGKEFRAKVNIYDAKTKFEEVQSFLKIDISGYETGGYINNMGEILTNYDGKYIRVPVSEGEQWGIWFEDEQYLFRGKGALRLENSEQEQIAHWDMLNEDHPNSSITRFKVNPESDVLGSLITIPSGVDYMCVPLAAFLPTLTWDNSETAIIGKYVNINTINFVAIGDSITEKNGTASKNWVDIVTENLSTTHLVDTTNLGISGYGYKGVSGTYYNQLSSIPENADLIVFYGSFNDLNENRQYVIGTANDAYIDGQNNTLGATMNYAYDYIKTNFPNAKLAVITPAPWYNSNPEDTSSRHSEYVKVMKEICNNKNIPCLDLYSTSGMTPWITEYKEQYYANSDGVHPNNEGHKILASKIVPFLQNVLNS